MLQTDVKAMIEKAVLHESVSTIHCLFHLAKKVGLEASVIQSALRAEARLWMEKSYSELCTFSSSEADTSSRAVLLPITNNGKHRSRTFPNVFHNKQDYVSWMLRFPSSQHSSCRDDKLSSGWTLSRFEATATTTLSTILEGVFHWQHHIGSLRRTNQQTWVRNEYC